MAEEIKNPLADISDELLARMQELMDEDDTPRPPIKIDIDAYLQESASLSDEDRLQKLIALSESRATPASLTKIADAANNLMALLYELAATDELERLATKQPDKFMMLIDKVTSSIYAPDIELLDAGKKTVAVGKDKARPYVKVDVASIADKDNIELQGKLTPYDKQVHNAVVTLCGAGNTTFTAANIYSAMTGGKRGRKSQIERITESIDKQRMIDVHIDASQEVKMFGYKCDKAVLKNNLLSAKGITVEAGGHKVDAYMRLDEPILYSYAKLSNYKIASIPAELLDVKELDNSGKLTAASIQDTPERMAIKGRLLERILPMERDEDVARIKYNTYLSRPAKDKEEKTLATFRQLKQRKINFDNLFKEAGIDINNRSTVKRYRDYCFQCLDYWQAKGLFKSWKQYKDGRKIMGVEIKF